MISFVHLLRSSCTMAVPKLSQLHPNVDVNIVLKSDQSSGKLTRGRISGILTRGDHPRGIKVRLTDGRVGRVQSLSTDLHSTSIAQATSSVPMSSDSLNGSSEVLAQRSSTAGRGERNGRVSRQGDYGGDPTPLQSRSLADYIKVPASSKIAPVPQIPVQAQLEKDFPKLDTALIAAILVDYEDVDTARSVLATLS
jgi:uncharacterized repeat protein (TIGR03833 family)